MTTPVSLSMGEPYGFTLSSQKVSGLLGRSRHLASPPIEARGHMAVARVSSYWLRSALAV